MSSLPERIKVGFLIPTMNNHELLSWAVRSARAQRVPSNVEVIVYVWDDGSYRSAEHRFLSVPGVIYEYCSENKGLPFALNQMITKAINDGCKFITRLDADEMAHPNRVAIAMKELESTDAKLLAYIVYNKSLALFFPTLQRIQLFLASTAVVHGTWFAHASIFANGYNEAYRRCQDVEFLKRVKPQIKYTKKIELSVCSLRSRGSPDALFFQEKIIAEFYPPCFHWIMYKIIRCKRWLGSKLRPLQ